MSADNEHTADGSRLSHNSGGQSSANASLENPFTTPVRGEFAQGSTDTPLGPGSSIESLRRSNPLEPAVTSESEGAKIDMSEALQLGPPPATREPTEPSGQPQGVHAGRQPGPEPQQQTDRRASRRKKGKGSMSYGSRVASRVKSLFSREKR